MRASLSIIITCRISVDRLFENVSSCVCVEFFGCFSWYAGPYYEKKSEIAPELFGWLCFLTFF